MKISIAKVLLAGLVLSTIPFTPEYAAAVIVDCCYTATIEMVGDPGFQKPICKDTAKKESDACKKIKGPNAGCTPQGPKKKLFCACVVNLPPPVSPGGSGSSTNATMTSTTNVPASAVD